MKKYLFILFLIVGSSIASAQEKSIVNDLNNSKIGQGSVKLYEDESIQGLLNNTTKNNKSTHLSNKQDNDVVGNNTTTSTDTKIKGTNFIRTRGYKIEVFMGNDQRRSKQEAESRKQRVEAGFPEMEVVINFRTPVWRVRAGNYKTYEQASQALKEMQKTFPAFGREMQIVEDVVKIPTY